MDRPLSKADVKRLSKEHGVSEGAVEVLAAAIAHGGGRGAQFNHPDLGGMGQWMAGGMLMIGDMFNNQLKAKVDRLCHAVAAAVAASPAASGTEKARAETAKGAGWWPAEFGSPGSTGAQNAMRYAVFPQKKRLVIDDNGAVAIYDTGEHDVTGVSQQQSGAQTLSFLTPAGPVSLSKLKRIR